METGVNKSIDICARKDMIGAALSCFGSRINIVVYNKLL